MTDVAPPLELDGPASAPGPGGHVVDLFGAAPPAYTVLARKYRPRRFEDLIGQEGMVRTLRNAFAAGRIAHAFMLTGVRGVGKTTTARLLARALNFESDTVGRPSLEALAGEGRHCPAILEGRHLDVLELDAASRTKVDEMRELLDGVRYAPAQARYKIYIIDEVHMLSTHAFNALLKTLEEPPPHAKFIFATTEIRKVPVTILSRCQRFDLRRVEPEVIAANLARIARAEGFQVDAGALTLIARAAEGSVRDAQSLLDQALVQVEAGRPVGEAIVRDMLGMVDRALTIGLFEEVVRGEAAAAITTFRDLYAHGADPPTVVMDLLEHCHAASVAKMLGPEALGLPQDQAARLTALGAGMGTGALSRIWQMLLKAHEEARQAPDPAAAVDMTLIRLAYAADLPGPEEAIRALRASETTAGGSGGSAASGAEPAARMAGGGGGRAILAGTPAPAPVPQGAPRDLPRTFEDIMRLVEARRDVALKLDLERYARPISVRPGAIVFEPTADAPADLAHRLSARLKTWTGQPWLVAAEGGGGAETFHEREGRAAREDWAAALAEPYIQALMTVFPGAELIAVRRLAVAESAAQIDERAEPTEED